MSVSQSLQERRTSCDAWEGICLVILTRAIRKEEQDGLSYP